MAIATEAPSTRTETDRSIDWGSSIPFFGVHLACLLAIVSGVSLGAVVCCLALVWIRLFGITAGYHRYFSHRTFKTSRAFQFVLALLGTLSLQKGVLWWSAHHRTHHSRSDQPGDVHSPKEGFFWSHLGWILCNEHDATDMAKIPDFARYPELRWLNRHFVLPYVGLCVVFFAAGGLQYLVWGAFVSTVILWHLTFSINSFAHIFGRRRFETTDTSRNNWLLALLTGGEGWHNNHHHYPNSANQGFYWWEIDTSYYLLRALGWFGIVWDLRKPPARILQAGRGQV